jgi:acyl-CoA reductase-like NAD-dependent aldehyde dehydrogenase
MPEKFILKDSLSSSDKIKQIKNPFTNEVVGEYYAAAGNDFIESAEYLTRISKDFFNLPVYKKAELLYNISNKISERKNEVAKLITDETGKPIKFSLIEADRAILTFRLGAEECSRIEGGVLSLDLLKGSENKTGIVKRFPIGTVLGITPWNFPINLVAHKVSPALASSNPIMIKPSSNSMLTAIALGKIVFESCNELGINFVPLNVLTLSGADIDKYIADERIKLISFTGSSDIGWGIKHKAGKQKVSLELGGNAGVIVNYDADIAAAAAKITLGGFAQAGQSCISVQRVYIHEKIYDETRSRLIEETKSVKFGDPYDENTIVGPMITEEEALRAEKWIMEARSAGAAILTGGNRNGAVLEPTIIENAPNNVNVKCSEVFAPVITIEKFSDFEDAVGEINNSRFGLQAGVFTNSMQDIMYAYNNIHAGGVIINEASAYRMDAMPYGGVKDSGNTREGVKYTIREMTEEKILVL